MKIETVAISSLTPDPKNARSHEQGVLELARSLEAFGQQKNLVVWHDTVIAGSGLLEAAKSLGWAKIAVSRTPDDWTYEQAQAFALADNRTAELSTWDLPVLEEIRFELDAVGWKMEEFGFDRLPTIARFGGNDPDFVPDLPENAKSKLGDLYQLGDHRLLCGDSTDEASYKRVMGGGVADLMWTDPPYGVSYVGKTADKLTIKGDDDAGLRTLLVNAFTLANGVLVQGSPFYCAHPPGVRSITFGEVILEIGWKIHETLIWVKNSMVLGHSDYHYRHEPIYYGWTLGEGRSGRGRHEGTKWYGDNSQTSILEYDRPSVSESHPTMKPVALVEKCISNSSQPRNIVLDPFGGSGSTLIACEQTSRQCRMIEIDPLYCDVIVKRWEDFTGKKATRTR